MRRLTRAIAELESFRSSLLNASWHSPSEIAVIGLINTAIAAITQVRILAPSTMRHGAVETNADRSAELIAQINDEIRDEKERAAK